MGESVYIKALERTQDALEALAIRLWCDDRPEGSSLASVDAWVANLPEDEAAALNGMLGESYGKGPAWDSEHPVSRMLTDARRDVCALCGRDPAVGRL